MSVLSELLPSGGGAGGSLEAVASGSLSNGDTVVVNSDGTVSVVSELAELLGTPTAFNSSSTIVYSSVTYDANAQKVVIAYRDQGNSNYGMAVVGTVSGTSISFGTPAVFESAFVVYISTTYDANAQKVVIAYRDVGNSDYGTAVVGTVSGTSISFGTPVVYNNTGETNFNSITYDTNAQKVVIAYSDQENSNHGFAIVGTVSGTSISFGTKTVIESSSSAYFNATYDSNAQKVVVAYGGGSPGYGRAAVGTVSGTSISFGTPVVFANSVTYEPYATYDSSSQKVVISYRNNDNSDYGTAVVGTVSGTSISFGTPVVFNTGTTYYPAIAYDANAQKVVIAYRDGGNSDYGTYITGTVSGTSISFDSETVFEAAATYYTYPAYDSDTEKFVIAYRDGGNSNYGTAVVLQSGSTNLTTGNFIGIADSDYSDGATATIQTVGATNDAQSGLTAGTKYYVQSDGTLGTTADDPEVVAGVALSSTELLLTGE